MGFMLQMRSNSVSPFVSKIWAYSPEGLPVKGFSCFRINPAETTTSDEYLTNAFFAFYINLQKAFLEVVSGSLYIES